MVKIQLLKTGKKKNLSRIKLLLRFAELNAEETLYILDSNTNIKSSI